MPPSVVILGLPESDFARRLGGAVEERGVRPAVLSLDAPLEGRPVTIQPGEILWEGVDLLGSGAVLVETPVYCWPQPQRLEALPMEPGARTKHLTADRETRSLALSALCIAAGKVPVINPPEAAYLAAAPGAALSRLASGGVPVQEWRLGPAPDPDAMKGVAGPDGAGSRSGTRPVGVADGLAPEAAGRGAIVLDAAGRDRFHRPTRPPAGEPALLLEPFEGPVLSLIVVGDRAVAARRYPSAAAWSENDPDGTLPESRIPAFGSALALRAAGLLGLPVAAIAITGDGAALRLLHADAGPDLAAWDATSGGDLAGALAAYLVSAASLPARAPRSDATLSGAPGTGALR